MAPLLRAVIQFASSQAKKAAVLEISQVSSKQLHTESNANLQLLVVIIKIGGRKYTPPIQLMFYTDKLLFYNQFFAEIDADTFTFYDVDAICQTRSINRLS